MRKLSHDEILKKKPSVSAIKRKKRLPVYAILDNVRSMHNVGAIFRTSDAVLLKKLYLCGITGHPPRKEISKTALGAEEVVPWEYHDDPIPLIKKLKKKKIHIVAVELTNKSVTYDRQEYNFPVCFVFGHEVEGISDEVIAECDASIDLPMRGRANSLNIATCYGIIMYEVLKKLKT